MDLGNKTLDGEKGRENVLKLMNYYINTNKITYINGVEEKCDDKASNKQEKDKVE